MIDTEAIAWSCDKLDAYGASFNSNYSAAMLDRLKETLVVAMRCAAVPTPPAQDAEPVYQRRFMNHDDAAWFDVSREEYDAETVIEKRILYTRLQPYKQEAEPVYLVCNDYGGWEFVAKDEFEKEEEDNRHILYTHAPSDKLLHAAHALIDSLFFGLRPELVDLSKRSKDAVANLRAALEGKS